MHIIESFLRHQMIEVLKCMIFWLLLLTKRNICGTYAYTKMSQKAIWDRGDKVELYE